MMEIKLTHGYVALVDDEDFALVEPYTWHTHWDHGKYKYARTMIPGGKRIFMHVMISAAASGEKPEGIMVDHRDGNGFDNRRDNLRYCTRSQNLANQPPRNSRSLPKGVYKRLDRFAAMICVNGKTTYIGSYDTPEEAGRAYDRAALEGFGEFAFTNDPRHRGPC